MVAYTYYESDPRVIREAEAAVEGGFEVDVLALRKPGTPASEVIHGVRVIRLSQAKYRGRGYAMYLLAYLEFFIRCLVASTTLFLRHRYRIIHVNNMPDFLVFSTIIPKVLGAKIILDIHDPMPNTFASKFRSNERGFFYRLLLWQERLSAAYCNRVLTVHEPVKAGILKKHGFSDASVDVIANFADDQLFALRTPFHLNKKIRFVFHGTIVERSGLRILINGLSGARHKDRMVLRIIGDGDFSAELKDLIRSHALEDCVEFDNCTYPVQSIPTRIADCDVGLVPLEVSSATNWALPLKLLEYISLGLPVMSVRNDAICHYFTAEDCLFFDWNNPDSLSQAFDYIVEHPEILMKYRARSVALRPRFSWTNESTKYIALLHRLAGVA